MRVHAALNKWQRRQFKYGDADCCQFIAFVVKELTGRDYAANFHYESEAQAQVLIGREGELVDFIGSILGKPSHELKDGDPCVVSAPIVGQVCGIKLKDKVVCLTNKGFAQIPDRYLISGWSV
tara:strand:- start:2136 stop:2504 length:369 start_codon:yes stop_codon:yes gene_type:complete